MRRFIIYWFAIACTVAFLSCKKDEAPKQPEQTAVEQVAPKAEEQPAAAAVKGTVKVEVESAQAHDHPHSHDAEEEDDDDEDVDEEKLKDNPLKLVGMEKMVVEDVTEITEKLLEFEVVNSSQEDVFFKRVRSSCKRVGAPLF